MKASIGIFNKSLPETAHSTRPEVPPEVFEAALRVSENKSTELVKTTGGLYVITYSENGPFQSSLAGEWLPVFILKPCKWASGGITQDEMKEYLGERATV